MQRLKHHITTLYQDSQSVCASADQRGQKARLDQLLHDAQAEPEVDIPTSLHQAGQPTSRLVSAHDIAALHKGKTIARAVRALLPHGAGNQRLTVASSHGRSVALTVGAQTLSDIHDDPSWMATSAILVGAGNCDEAARIAFEIARSYDVPAAIVGDHHAAHTFALLYPEATRPVVVDAWPIFPSSCLIDDSPFKVDRVIAKHDAGDAVPRPFNLPLIETLQQKVHSQLGEHAIENLMRETLRQRYQVRLRSLDRLLMDQGLLHYHQLKPEQMDDAQRALFEAKVEKLKTRMADVILHQVANLISTQTSESEPQQRLWKNGLGRAQDMQSASESARQIARDTAQHRARNDSNNLAVRHARKNADRCADLKISRSFAHTEMRGLAVVTAENTVTVRARAKPALWHTLLHGGNIRYHSPGGQTHRIATAPQSLIDATLKAQAVAEELGYPDTYRTPDHDIDQSIQRKQDGVSDAELMQHCVARIADCVDALHASTKLPQSVQRAAREMMLLNDVDERFEDVAMGIKEVLLIQLVKIFPQLHPDVVSVAMAHWMRWQGGSLPGEVFTNACLVLRKIWFAHLSNERIESTLRPAVLACTPAANVIEFATAHLSAQSPHYAIFLQLLDICWPQLPDEAATTLAHRRLADTLNRIDDYALKTSGLQILDRYGSTYPVPAAPLSRRDTPL